MKILFLSEGVSLAHIGRPLTLAKWASEAGHIIHFACCKEGLSKIGSYPENFNIHYLNQTIKSSVFYTRVKKGNFFYTFNEMNRYVNEEINLYKNVKPDLIVTDFRLTAPISSKICNLPLLNLSNSHWSPHRDCPFPAPDNSFLGSFPTWLKKGLFSLIRPMTFKLFAFELNRIRKHYGLETKNDFRQLYTDGDFNAYLDLPEFSEIKKLPENHFFLGPVLWNATGPELPHKIENGIYISMGSTGNNELIAPILKAVLNTKAFVILSGISDSEKIELLRKYPDLINRSWVQQLVDPDRILGQCNLTICHGGSGTVYQSLAHGTPVLCFPSNPDQYLVSYAVHNHNLGDYIEKGKSSRKTIFKKIMNCLNNQDIIKNAKSYVEKIKSHNTCKIWCHFLNKFTNQCVIPTQFSKEPNMKTTARPSSVSIGIKDTFAYLKRDEPLKKTGPTGLTIKLANNLEDRQKVFRLAYQVYFEKGFTVKNTNEWYIQNYDMDSNTAILMVTDVKNEIVGSVTLVFNERSHLPAEKIYKNELNSVKKRIGKIAEISRLTVSPDYRNSKDVLILLFNYLAIFVDLVKNYSGLVIEVNPRHKAFYKELLGFEEIGTEKACPSVQDAPASLLLLTVSKYRQEVMRHQNIIKQNKRTRSLYPYFINTEQERLVAKYLKKQVRSMSAAEKLYFGFTESGITRTVHV